MKPAIRIAIAGLSLLALAACESEKVETLKSPCAGAENSPCGPKRVPVDNRVSARILDQA